MCFQYIDPCVDRLVDNVFLNVCKNLHDQEQEPPTTVEQILAHINKSLQKMPVQDFSVDGGLCLGFKTSSVKKGNKRGCQVELIYANDHKTTTFFRSTRYARLYGKLCIGQVLANVNIVPITPVEYIKIDISVSA